MSSEMSCMDFIWLASDLWKVFRPQFSKQGTQNVIIKVVDSFLLPQFCIKMYKRDLIVVRIESVTFTRD